MAYSAIIERDIHRSHLGIPNLIVLTVTTNENRVLEMTRQLEQRGWGSSAFLFRSLEASAELLTAPYPDLLPSRWRRCGDHPAMSIASPSS
jgi:hypothetical protein